VSKNIASIFRIFVPVSDFDAALTFYQRLFGTNGKLIHRGRQYFYCGPVIFAVIENSGPPIDDHVYFSVKDWMTSLPEHRNLIGSKMMTYMARRRVRST